MSTSLKNVKGVGPKRLEVFLNAGLETVEDLVHLKPREYKVYQALDYYEAECWDKFVLCGTISSKLFSKSIRKNVAITGFTLTTPSNQNVYVRIFGANFYQIRYKKGDFIAAYGTKREKNTFYVAKMLAVPFKPYIEPVYRIKYIPDSLITKIIQSEFENISPSIMETLPEYLIKKYRLLSNNQYFYLLHNPTNKEDLRQLNRREKYEMYLHFSLKLAYQNSIDDVISKVPKEWDEKRVDSFISTLPFNLTSSQMLALDDIRADVCSNRTMNRLIQGDVGSGKTIISIICAYNNYLNGYQAIMLAPTEILACQHYLSFKGYLESLGVRVAFLSSSVTKAARDEIIKGLENQDIDILVSTHAVLFHQINFKRLGLYIVDEQHRFGVSERDSILKSFKGLDALYMSATPIPRTLGLTRFAGLSLTALEQKPQGRKEIITKTFTFSDLEQIYADIQARINRHEQAYAVCSVIDESDYELLDIKECRDLIQDAIPSARLGLLHGAMKDKEKNQVMEDFKAGNIDILVSTTVIEVGVDVKNATGIYIFNAERFGLTTLHQLRGRVGRNDLPAFCALISKRSGIERLNYLSSTNDCFKIAEFDLKMRGPGDLLGVSQSGFNGLDFSADGAIFDCARTDAFEAFDKYQAKQLDDYTMKGLIENIKNDNAKLN